MKSVILFFAIASAALADIQVSKNSLARTVVEQGEAKAPILSLKIVAPEADVSLRSLEIEFDGPAACGKAFKNLCVVDENGKELVRVDAVSANKLTLRFFASVVRGQSKIFRLLADVQGSLSPEARGLWKVSVRPYGVVATQGLNDIYGPPFLMAQSLMVVESLSVASL